MNAFFIYLCCLLGVSLIVGIVGGLFERYHAWKGRQDLLQRDLKVKDALIAQLTLENRMLQVQLNMSNLVIARQKERRLRLVSTETPSLLRPQV